MDMIKKYMPKSLTDACAFGFTLFMIHAIALFELVVVLPYIDSDHEHHKERMPTFWVHFAIGVFLYINTMGSFAMTLVSSSSTRNVILPSILKPGWKFCSSCEANSPPRTYHCWTCNICVLKRDHHCMFTGNCIGHNNMRYFMTMVFFLCLGAGYCNFLNMDYTWELIGGFTPISIFTMFMPLFSWLLGFAASYTFGVAFISSTCIIGFLLLAALFGYHFINTANGQTTFERTTRNKEYDLGFVENVKDIYGERWYVAWMSPFIPSKLPNDGIEFKKKFGFEDVKDM